MLSYDQIDALREKGIPELFSRDQEGIYQELATYYQSENCANRPLFADQVEALEFRAVSYERAVANEELQHATSQQSPLFATGQDLDHRAAERGLARILATFAITTLRFTLSAVTPHDVIIAKGTRVSAGRDETVFLTDADLVIKAGQAFGTMSATAQTAGAAASDLPIGAVSSILDPIAFVAKVANITVTGGGADTEDDRRLRFRTINYLELASNAGPRGAYKGYVLKALPNITDCNIISCNSIDVTNPPAPCHIHIYLLFEGGRAPNDEEMKIVLDYLHETGVPSSKKQGRVPHGDKITVFGAIKHDFQYKITIRHTGLISDLEPQIKSIMRDHERHWQNAIGRDVASSKLTGALERVNGIVDAQADFEYLEIDGRNFAKGTGTFEFIKVAP